MPIFEKDLDNFGLILRGKSIEKIHLAADKFQNFLIVNNFDKEIDVTGKHLRGKRGAQLVNMELTAKCSRANYELLGIKDIMFSRREHEGHRRAKVGPYAALGLNTHYTPSEVWKYLKDYPNADLRKKFPNTGMLGFAYCVYYLTPKNLWIVGLDFYHADYLFRRPHQTVLPKQRNMTDSNQLVEVFVKTVKRNPNINFHMVTYCKELPNLPNLEIL